MRQGQSTLTHKDAQVPNPHKVELDTGIRWSRHPDAQNAQVPNQILNLLFAGASEIQRYEPHESRLP